MSRIEKALEVALKRREAKNSRENGGANLPSIKTSGAPQAHAGENVFPKVTTKFNLDSAPPLLAAVLDSGSAYAEYYRRIRTSLINRTRQGEGNTLLVTSSLKGEGKTATSVNLSVVMAKDVDHTVLLVDADLRSPAVDNYLGIETKKGLSDYLIDDSVKLSDVLVKTGIGKLVLLPAGSPVSNPSEILTSKKMNRLIGELKSRYHDRYVIFDSAPLLAASESETLASWVDGTVFVLEEGRIPQKTSMQAFELIKNYNILGVVMNNTNGYLVCDFAGYAYNHPPAYGPSPSNAGKKS